MSIKVGVSSFVRKGPKGMENKTNFSDKNDIFTEVSIFKGVIQRILLLYKSIQRAHKTIIVIFLTQNPISSFLTLANPEISILFYLLQMQML